MPIWLKKKLHLSREMRRGLAHAYRKRFVFTEHHESHAASAFFPSPFDEAAILTVDGVGEWATASYGTGKGNRISLTHQLHFPHSPGMLYSAFTYYCGFKVNSGEYKLMGLAPYGEPKHVDLILEKLIDLKDDGSFRMDMSYFNYCQGLTMTSKKFDRLFGGPPRSPETLLTERDMDIAASIQAVIEEIMLRMARHVHAETGMKKLCLAGGVALNCVANGRILREGPFEDLWIQPAAGDAGGALGVALFIWHQLLDKPRAVNRSGCPARLVPRPAVHRRRDPPLSRQRRRPLSATSKTKNELCDAVAGLIADEKVVGWLQGRMEFGPRALGSRSILGDARSEQMQSTMNLKIKFRESFRPFAPSVLQERVDEFFETRPNEPSPYMLLVAPVRQGKAIRAQRPRSRPGGDCQAQIEAFGRAGDHARRLFGPYSNGRCGPSRPVLQAAQGVRAADRFARHHQYEFQRPRRADRPHAAAGVPLLHVDQYRRARAGTVCPVERRAASGQIGRPRKVSGRVQAGLTMIDLNLNPSKRDLRIFSLAALAFSDVRRLDRLAQKRLGDAPAAS